MNPRFHKFLGVLLAALAVAVPRWSSAAVDEALLDELCGLTPNPRRQAGDWEALYLEGIGSLSMRLASQVAPDRAQALVRLHGMESYVGGAGAEVPRKAMCAAIAKQLDDPAFPPLGRHALIRMLGAVGDDASLPALAKLIGGADKIEADMARMSLQQIPGEPAEQALLAALKASSDTVIRIGLIDAIGARKVAAAVADLEPFLADPEPEVAAVAAIALGRIGGPLATRALGSARGKSTDEAAQRFLELGLLDIANQRGRSGDLEGAAKLFQVLGTETKHRSVQTAAMMGVARAAPKLADEIVILAIKSKDPRMRSAGISAAIAVPSKRLATGLVAMLETQPKNTQIQILNALAAKGDLSVQDKVVEFLKKQEGKDLELESAAITALGSLGSVKVIELLLQKSVATDSTVRAAAQAALGQFSGADIAQAIEFHARAGKTPAIRAVAIGLFMRNRDRTGLTRIMAFAAEPDADVSSAAFAVLRKEAGDGEFRQLLDLLNANKLGVLPVLAAVSDRTKDPDLLTSDIITYLRGTENLRAKRFLIQTLQILGSPRGLPIVVEYVDEPKVADNAMKALSNWPDPAALPEMLRLFQKGKDDRVIVGLMTKGIAKLVGESEELSMDKRAYYLSEAFELCPNARERLMLIPPMAKVPHKLTVEIIEKMLGDRYVSGAAADVAVALAEKLAESEPDMAKSLAVGVTKGGFHSGLRGRAQAVLDRLKLGNNSL